MDLEERAPLLSSNASVIVGAQIGVLLIVLLFFLFRPQRQATQTASKATNATVQQQEPGTEQIGERKTESPSTRSENEGTQTVPRRIIGNSSDEEFMSVSNGDSSTTSNMSQYEVENKANLRRRIIKKDGNKASSIESSRQSSFTNLNKLDDHSENSTPEFESLSEVVAGITGDNKIRQSEQSYEKPVEIEAKSALKPVTLTVNKNGLKFKAPYCEVEFPRHAVTSQYTIEVVPHYGSQLRMPGKMFITPIVEFKSARVMDFGTDVRVRLYTPYSSLKRGESVAVEIMRLKHGDEEFRTFATAKLEQDGFISFWCRSFCR